MPTKSKSGGVYIEIDGNVEPFINKLEQAKNKAEEIALQVVKGTNKAFAAAQVEKTANSITKNVGLLKVAVRALGTDVSAFGSKFAELTKIMGYTGKQAEKFGDQIAHALHVKEAKNVEKYLRSLQYQIGLTKSAYMEMAQAVGATDAAFKQAQSVLGTRTYAQIKQEMRDIVKAYETYRKSGVASEQDVARARQAALESIRKLRTEAGLTVRSVEDLQTAFQKAFSGLGIRSSSSIKDEMKQIVTWYKTIRDSGTATANEIKNAHEKMRTSLQALKKELVGTSQQVRTMERDLASATKGLGFRTDSDIRAEMKRIVQDYLEVKTNANATANEVYKAHSRMLESVRALHSELHTIPTELEKQRVAINKAYGTLKIVSVEDLQAQRRAIIEAFTAIKQSASSTPQDIRNARTVALKALAEINQGLRTTRNEFITTGEAMKKAFGTVGVRSDATIRAEMQSIVEAYKAIKNNSNSTANEVARAHQRMIASVRELNKELHTIPSAMKQQSAAISGAFKTLNIRSLSDIRAEMAQVVSAYHTLRDSGTATASELSRAHAKMKSDLAALKGEAKGVGERFQSEKDKINDAFAKLQVKSAATVKKQLEDLRKAFERIKATGVRSDIAAAEVSFRRLTREITTQTRAVDNLWSSFGKSAAVFAGGLFTVHALVQSIREITTASIESSTSLDRLRIAYESIYGGAEEGKRQLEFIYDQAKLTGQEYVTLAESAKTFFAAGNNSAIKDNLNDIFKAVNASGAALQLNAVQMQRVYYAIGQMISKGKVSAEEMRQQLGEQLPGAFQLAAAAMEMELKVFDKAMADGKIMTDEFLPKFGQKLMETYGEKGAKAGNMMQGAMNKAKTEFELLKAALVDSDTVISFFNSLEKAMIGLRESIESGAFDKIVDGVLAASAALAASGLIKGITSLGTAIATVSKFLGGPWKLALAVATGALGYFISDTDAATEISERYKNIITESEAVMREYGIAIGEVNKKIDDIKIENISKKIERVDKDLDTLSKQTLDELNKLDAQLIQTGMRNDDFARSTKDLKGVWQEYIAQLKNGKVNYESIIKTIVDIGRLYGIEVDHLLTIVKSTEAATIAKSKLKDQMQQMKDAANPLISKLIEMGSALWSVYDAALNAGRGLQQARAIASQRWDIDVKDFESAIKAMDDKIRQANIEMAGMGEQTPLFNALKEHTGIDDIQRVVQVRTAFKERGISGALHTIGKSAAYLSDDAIDRLETLLAKSWEYEGVLVSQKKHQEALRNATSKAHKSGSAGTSKAIDLQQDYTSELDRTLASIESYEDQLNLVSSSEQKMAEKRRRVNDDYERSIKAINDEYKKFTSKGGVSKAQAEGLKKQKLIEASLKHQIDLRAIDAKQIESERKALEGVASLLDNISTYTGDYAQASQLRMAVIDKEAERLVKVEGLSKDIVDEWAKWQKLEISKDPFDGAYRGLKKFTAELSDSGKQWENLAQNFAQNFESTIHNMFDDFLETGKVSFDDMSQLFKNLLKQMAYQALVQPVVVSVVNGVAGALYGGTTAASGTVNGTSAQGGVSGAASSMGQMMSSAATSYVANKALNAVGGGATGWLSGGINSMVSSIAPSYFAPSAAQASVNTAANALNAAYGGAASTLPTQTATGVLSSGWTMGAGLIGSALGNYLLAPALGINTSSTASQIGGMAGGLVGSVGGGLLGSAALGASLGSWGGPIGAGIGALVGTIGGLFGGSLFGGGYEDTPGYYIQAFTDLTNEEGLKGFKGGTYVHNHRWDSFTDSMAEQVREGVARPLMEAFRENTVGLKEQISTLGGSELGEAFFASVRKEQVSGGEKIKKGINVRDYFEIYGSWEGNSIDAEEWVEEMTQHYQEVIVKSIANMDMSSISKAADGMAANTEEEIAIALAKAGQLISVGDTIEDEELKESFEQGISKSLVKALKKMDTSKLGLTIDKSSLEGWNTAIQAMSAWTEATKQIELLKNPVSEVTSQLATLDTQFLQWISTLEQLGWQEKKVKEIEEERIDALYRASSEYLDKYIEKDSVISGLDDRFNDVQDILQALTDSGAKKADSKQYADTEAKGHSIIEAFINASLDSYVNAESASSVLQEGSAAFEKVLTHLETLNADDAYDVVTKGLIQSTNKLFDTFKKRAEEEVRIAEEAAAEEIRIAEEKAAEEARIAKKQARDEVQTAMRAYRRQSEYSKALINTSNEITSLIISMRELGFTANEIAQAEQTRTRILQEQAAELVRQTNQNLNLRVSALRYGTSSSQYQLQDTEYKNKNELAELERQFGIDSPQYKNAANIQEAELIQLKINMLENQLKDLYANKIQELQEEVSAAQSLKSTFESILKSLESARSDLWTGEDNLTTSRYIEAYRVFNDTYTRAMQGDEDALGKLPSAANTLLQLGRDQLSTRGEYETTFFDVNTKLKAAEELSKGQISEAEKQLDTAQAQLDALKAQQKAITGQTNTINGSIESIIAEIELLKAELSERLSTLIVSTDNISVLAQQSLSAQDMLIQAKVDQLNATAYLGRTDWTSEALLKAIEEQGLTLESWYVKYGQYENLGVIFDAVGSALSKATDQEMSILEKKLSQLQEGWNLRAGETAESWDINALVYKMLEGGMSIQQWYDRFGRDEFLTIQSLQGLSQSEILEAKAALMNLGISLGKGQEAGNWTAESVLKSITESGLTFTQWFNKYGSHEFENAARNAGLITGSIQDLMQSSAAYYNLLLEKAQKLNEDQYTTAQIAAGGWTPANVLSEINSRGMTVDEWYEKFGRSEGFFLDAINKNTTSTAVGLNNVSVSISSRFASTEAMLQAKVDDLNKKSDKTQQWTIDTLRQEINEKVGSVEEWWEKYGKNESWAQTTPTTNTTKRTSSKASSSVKNTESDLLAAKAAAMNAGKTLAKGQTAGGWTASKVKNEIQKAGLTVSEWYDKYGKKEGFASGGITPSNKAYVVGEQGPELLMSPSNYGILNNRDSIELMRAGYGNQQYVDLTGVDMNGRESNNILRQLLRKTDRQEYMIEKLQRVIETWNQEGLPATA